MTTNKTFCDDILSTAGTGRGPSSLDNLPATSFTGFVTMNNGFSAAGAVFTAGITLLGGATLLTTSTSLTSGAAAATGTLTNAPAAGNPTKWIAINDNGTTRYIPAW